MANRVQIRREIRQRRAQLTKRQQSFAQVRLANHAQKIFSLLSAKRILSYIPIGGEISPHSVEAMFTHAETYIPSISHFEKGQMAFYSAKGPTITNRFGITEPKKIGSPLPARHLDVVLVPLVAFDRRGNRLGMGGGFYDRAFSFKLDRPQTNRPTLIGLAHSFQEASALESQEWDVPLDVIITNQEFIRISR